MTGFLFDRNPWAWGVAVTGFVATTIVGVLFVFFDIEFSRTIELVIGLCLTVGGVPAVYGALIELSRIDTRKRTGRIIATVMGSIILIFAVFGLGVRSLNNMLGVFGLGIPFYTLLRAAWIEVFLATSSIFVFSAVIVRKYGLTTDFEEPVDEVHRKWTVGGIMMMAGLILIFLGVFVAYVDPLALEGLIITVSGLVLFPVGRLVWKRSKKTKLDSRSMAPIIEH